MSLIHQSAIIYNIRDYFSLDLHQAFLCSMHVTSHLVTHSQAIYFVQCTDMRPETLQSLHYNWACQ